MVFPYQGMYDAAMKKYIIQRSLKCKKNLRDLKKDERNILFLLRHFNKIKNESDKVFHVSPLCIVEFETSQPVMYNNAL